MRNAKNHFKKAGKPVVAALLAGMILLLDAMAACPALHEMIHKDADKPDHECAVMMFAHGKAESATVDVPVAVMMVPIETASQIRFSISSAAIENLPASRAPPAVISSQV